MKKRKSGYHTRKETALQRDELIWILYAQYLRPVTLIAEDIKVSRETIYRIIEKKRNEKMDGR